MGVALRKARRLTRQRRQAAREGRARKVMVNKMKAGIIFANSGPFCRPELFGQLAREAEELGFDSIWTVEHVVVPQPHMPYPGSKDGQMPGGDEVPIPDPLIPLAYAAAITSKIKLAN